jgi:predicted phage tail protein
MGNILAHKPPIIAGAGSSKGGGGSGWSEVPETLESVGTVTCVDLLCEGEIEGLANGAMSVYLNGTALQNPDGSFNYNPSLVQIVGMNTGAPGQLPMQGITDVESETPVGTLVQAGWYGTEVPALSTVDQNARRLANAIVQEITDTSIDAVRVTLGVPGLYSEDTSTGSINDATIQFAIDIKDSSPGAVYQPVQIGITSDSAGYTIPPGINSTLGGFSSIYQAEIVFDRQIVAATVMFGFIMPKQATFAEVTNPDGTITTNITVQSVGTITVELQYQTYSGSDMGGEGGSSGSWQTFQTVTYTAADMQVPFLTSSGTKYATVNGFDFEKTFSLPNLPPAYYNVQAIITTQTGNVNVNASIAGVGATSSPYTSDITIGTLTGCARSKYEVDFTIPLTGTPPWEIRVSRITPDSSTVALVNQLYWDAFTQIINYQFQYPNSAYIALKASAQLFSSIPQRVYDVKLLKIQVPSNYNPGNRFVGGQVYEGIWDGTFVTAWSDNPAWCFYDLISHPRYGLGDNIQASLLDKWSFYQIGQYCDAVNESGVFVGIPDGFGGLEPRFTCNYYITSQADAFTILSEFAGIFRGMAYWSANSIVPTQDAPANSSMLFTSANVENGLFTYSGTARRARHTAVQVSWTDLTDLGNTHIEYVDDPIGIQRYGYNLAQITAVGCTSRGQAHRVGLWLLYTEINETETLTFRTGFEGVYIRPGSIITVADPYRMNRIRMGGRIVSVNSDMVTVNLDAPVTLASGVTFSLSIVLPDGSLSEYNADGSARDTTIRNSAGTTSALVLNTTLLQTPLADAAWVLSGTNNEPALWRVVSVVEPDKNILEISTTSYDPNKYTYVEQELTFWNPQPVPTPFTQVDPPTNVTMTQESYTNTDGTAGTQIAIEWDASDSLYVTGYNIQVQRQGQTTWTTLPYSGGDLRVCLTGVYPGTYTSQLTAVNILGVYSVAVYCSLTVMASTELVPDITGLEILGAGDATEYTGQDFPITWNVPPSTQVALATNAAVMPQSTLWIAYYQIQVYSKSSMTLRRTAMPTINQYVYTYENNYLDGNGIAERDILFSAKIFDISGNCSPDAVTLEVDNPAPPVVTGIVFTPFIQSFQVSWNPVNVPDLANYIVYGSQTITDLQGTPPYPAQMVLSRSPATSAFITQVNQGGLMVPLPYGTWYFMIAASDNFGEDELNYSAIQEIYVPPSVDTIIAIVQGAISSSCLTTDLQEQIDSAPTNASLSALTSEVNTLSATVGTYSASIQTLEDIQGITSGQPYNPASSYTAGAVVVYNNTLYQNDTGGTVGPEAWNNAHWTEITASLYAQYMVKLDVNGYVCGFGMANNGSSSQFIVNCNYFAVIDPGNSAVVPFVVSSEYGVVMNNAMIQQLTASNINTSTLEVGDGTGGTIAMGPLATIAWGKVINSPTNINNLVLKSTFNDGSLGTWASSLTMPSDNTGDGESPANTGNIGYIQVFSRDTYEGGNIFPVMAGEILYVEALLQSLHISNTPASGYTNNLGFGLCFYSSAKVINNFVLAGSIAPDIGWTQINGTIAVPSNAAYAMPWIQINEATNTMGYGKATQLSISRFQPGATIGAQLGSNLFNADGSLITSGWTSIGANFVYTGNVETNQLAAGSALIGSALIANGAIGNAQLGTAAVQTANIATANITTLTVAGNAITIPVSAYTTGPITYTAPLNSTGTVTIQTAVITTNTINGIPPVVMINGGLLVYGSTTTGADTATITICRNGTALQTITLNSFIVPSIGYGAQWNMINMMVPISLSDSPPDGDNTYTITYHDYYINASLSNISLNLLGAQR